jgi:epoxyqueuosine reductase
MRPYWRESLVALDLAQILTWDEPMFKQRFAGTPMVRAKRHGLFRNICVALGNIGSPADLPCLEKAAADPHPLIAEHAQWAISEIRSRHGPFGS